MAEESPPPQGIHDKNNIAGRMTPFGVPGFWDKKHRDMLRRHARIAGIFGPLPGSRHFKLKTGHDSACNCILSVVTILACVVVVE